MSVSNGKSARSCFAGQAAHKLRFALPLTHFRSSSPRPQVAAVLPQTRAPVDHVHRLGYLIGEHVAEKAENATPMAVRRPAVRLQRFGGPPPFLLQSLKRETRGLIVPNGDLEWPVDHSVAGLAPSRQNRK